jgi:uncharacterized repeat protein (TIGR03847 family)
MGHMARRLFIFDRPDRFVAGTIGEPGQREFHLQARKGGAVVSVGLEKTQVAVLAARLGEVLSAVDHPPPAAGQTDADPLEEPIIDLFRVGAMALAWDPASRMVVIEARDVTEEGEYSEVEDDADDGPDLLRVRIPPDVAHGFVRRAEALVSAGRPACPFCGQPLGREGHFCARASSQLN